MPLMLSVLGPPVRVCECVDVCVRGVLYAFPCLCVWFVEDSVLCACVRVCVWIVFLHVGAVGEVDPPRLVIPKTTCMQLMLSVLGPPLCVWLYWRACVRK